MTTAFAVEKLTAADSTPGTFDNARSFMVAQLAQCMPEMWSSVRFIVVAQDESSFLPVGFFNLLPEPDDE